MNFTLQRPVAVLLFLVAVTLGIGGALEFRYFGPDTKQFWAGVAAVPAGLVAAFASVELWRRGAAARRAVLTGSLILFAATGAGALLDVMGPPAIILGAGAAVVALVWVSRQSGS